MASGFKQQEYLLVVEMLDRLDAVDYLRRKLRMAGETGRGRRAFGHATERSCALETATRTLEAVAGLGGAVRKELRFVGLHVNQVRARKPISCRKLGSGRATPGRQVGGRCHNGCGKEAAVDTILRNSRRSLVLGGRTDGVHAWISGRQEE
jgi:hypothetical protein